MKFILNKDKLTIEENEERNSGSVKYYEAEVEFDESWEGLTIEARLVQAEYRSYADEGKGIAVINGKVFIDNELSGSFGIGFVGYRIENDTKVYQISSELKSIWFEKGAGEIEVTNEVPNISEWEIYIAQIQAIANEARNNANSASQSAENAHTSEINAKESEENAEASKEEAEQLINGFEDTVEGATNTFNQNAVNKTNDFNQNVIRKTNEFNEIVDEFNTNATQKTTDFNNNASTKTTNFNNNANEKTTEFNTNASTKVDEYNTNAEEKLDEFNENAESYNNRITELEEETERLRNVIPSDTAEGNPIYINDSADLPLNKFVLEGKTEQDSTTGANIFDLKKFLSDRNITYTENADGSLTFDTTGAGALYNNRFKISDENIVVSMSGILTNVSSNNVRFELIDKSNNIVGYLNKNIATLENKSCCELRMNWSTAGTVTMKNIMLNKGATAEEYVEHAEKTYNFPLSEGQKLMQDGTIENKVVNEWGELILTGTENWTDGVPAGDTSGNSLRFSFAHGISNIIASTIVGGFCNYFQASGTTYAVQATRLQYSATDLFIRLKLSELNITTKEELKSWLATKYASGNPVKIQYKLATPDETAFTTDQKSVIDEIIKDGTYKEVTHYTAEASINPDMEIGYYKDLETEFNNIKNAVIALGGNLDV